MGQSTARHALIAPSAYDPTPALLDPSLLRQDPAALARRLRATRGFEPDAAAVERPATARKRIPARTQAQHTLPHQASQTIGHAQAEGVYAPAPEAQADGRGPHP